MSVKRQRSLTGLCTIDGCGRKYFGKGWCLAHYKRWKRHGDPLSGGPYRGEEFQWVVEHIDYEGEDCLIYPYGKDGSLGGIMYAGKLHKVPRLMCILRHGPPPTESHEAAHSCGKRHLGCVNPNHLKWATDTENARDKFIHGTNMRGSTHVMSKLTEDEVRQIRSLIGTIPQKDIAEMFGVSRPTITNIKKGDSWGWLDEYAHPDYVRIAREQAREDGSPFVCEAVE